MTCTTNGEGLAFFQEAMMTLSDDGFVRLTMRRLWTVSFVHLLSGLDEHDELARSFEGACLDLISGYTEWVSTTSPVITLGWDWWLDASSMALVYTHVGEARSNVMIVDASNRDLGRRKTDTTLATLISTFPWKTAVAEHIRSRYA